MIELGAEAGTTAVVLTAGFVARDSGTDWTACSTLVNSCAKTSGSSTTSAPEKIGKGSEWVLVERGWAGPFWRDATSFQNPEANATTASGTTPSTPNLVFTST